MCGHGDCIAKTLVWITLPVWLPLYVMTVPPYRCSRKYWRRHIGPVHEYRILQPVPKERGPRRKLSVAALDRTPLKPTEEKAIAKVSEKAIVVAEKPVIKARASPQARSNACGFWKLPIEIRLMIWKELLLLEYNGSVEVCLFSNRPDKINLYSYDAVRNLDATVLRLNRQFYLEGMNILYQQNTFRMRSEAVLSSFGRRVAPSRLAQIHTLHFAVQHFVHKPGEHRRSLTFNSRVWKDACEDLKKFTGLQQLRITLKFDLGTIYGRCYSDPAWSRKLFERVFDPLAEVEVKEGGEFTVGYTWFMGICDSWPKGSFTMRRLDDGVYWW